MKVIAQTAALRDALTLASSIVAPRTPKPVLQCVKVVAGEDVLTVLATDLEVACRYVLPQVEIKAPGEALVPVQKFADIARESTSETLSISVEKEACTITGAGSRFRLLGYDPAEYPAVDDFQDEGDFQVSWAALNELVNRTVFAAARAHSHYAISGVKWEAEGKKLQLIATDSHRLAVAKTALPAKAAREVTAIVPSKLMGLIQRVGDGDAQASGLAVKVTETQILIRTARAVLISSLVQGNFPKYADVIPRDCTSKAVLQTEQFNHCIRQAALLTSEESKSVRLSFAADTVTLTGRAPETGEAEVSMPVTFTGEPLEVAFNPNFLVDVLKVVGAEEVTLHFNAPNKPAMLKAGADFTYVLMPVDLG